ncbi:hypothetical protein QA601_16205 [Chitinispirillales bacterium ANBcel5]|uniref:hypothetical protein n=1 Tax=Cellulosispirillum alkaliphilum TaxID=3039283 RepID=UPI002A51B1BB|nr:hypothetical protein [Chitinispirillales bacterium ANBcel5]
MKFEIIPNLFFKHWKFIALIIVLAVFILPFKSIYFNNNLLSEYFIIVYHQIKSFTTSFLMISFVLVIQVFNPLCGRRFSNLFLIFFVGFGSLAGFMGLVSIPYQSTSDIYSKFDMFFSSLGTIVGTIIMYQTKMKRLEKKQMQS